MPDVCELMEMAEKSLFLSPYEKEEFPASLDDQDGWGQQSMVEHLVGR